MVKTLGRCLLEVLDNAKRYEKILETFQNTYLQEDTEADIQHILNIVLSEARETSEFPVHDDGYLEAEHIQDEVNDYPTLHVLLVKGKKKENAARYPLKKLLNYPFPNFSYDALWITDLLWGLLFESDTHPVTKKYQKLDQLDYEFVRDGNREVADHTYNDNDVDEGAANYVEPLDNL